MRILYFDCFSGISGDMAVGAFLDAGLPLEDLKKELRKLPLDGYDIRTEHTEKHGIGGTKFIVDIEPSHQHRDLAAIASIINESSLDHRIKKSSLGMFTLLAEAEGAVHGVPPEKVHFHEVGAVDSIVDIVGCAAAMHLMGIAEAYSSPVPLGSGFVKSRHGELPVPAPATLALLKDKPVYQNEIKRELTTPTGAAILAYFAKRFGSVPPMRPSLTGYGAGTADLPIPNLLRIIIGETIKKEDEESVLVMETNIDDMNPEFCEYLAERLFAAGALDVAVIPLMMKKFRPAFLLKAVIPATKRDEIAGVIFRETTTAGIRYHETGRITLPRETVTVSTPYGSVRVKILRAAGSLTYSPEYEDCRALAEKENVPLKEIYEAAKQAAREEL